MDIQQLEIYLNKGNSFGINFHHSNDSVAWMLLSKRFPVNRFFSIFDREGNEDLYDEQMFIKEYPYQLRTAIVKKSVYDGDVPLTNESYLVNENKYFKKLADVSIYLNENQLGDIKDLKWSSDIEFL